MSKSHFCSFRWTDSLVNIASCTVQSCCKTPPTVVLPDHLNSMGSEVFVNFPKIVEERSQLLAGQKPDSCSYCWNLEEQGLPSTRAKSTSQNTFFQNLPEKMWTRSGRTKILEIVMSNQCQMSCLYCSPRFSSQWQKRIMDPNLQVPTSVKEHLKIPSSRSDEDIDLFRQSFFDYLEKATPELEEIIFIGGEPLLQKELFPLLQLIKKLRSPDGPRLEIRIISNLSVPVRIFDSFLNQLTSLNLPADLVLSPSLDSIGSQGEYIREGLEWDTFQTNLQKAIYSQFFKKIEFINTASCLSLFGLPSFLRFFVELIHQHPQQKFSLVVNQVQNPFFLSPQVHLPGHIESLETGLAIVENLEGSQFSIFSNFKTFLKSILNLHKNSSRGFDEKKFKELTSFLDWTDRLTGKDYRTLFPQMDNKHFPVSLEGL